MIKAGKGAVIFDEDARKRIYKMSRGIPRLINLISSRAIMAAFVSGNASIQRIHVNYAIEHLSDEPASGKFLSYSRYVALIILFVMAIFSGIYKVSGNVPGTIGAGKELKERTGGVISKNTAMPVLNRSQATIRKTEIIQTQTKNKMTTGESQAQKTQYPPDTPFVPEITGRSALENAKGAVIVTAEIADIRSVPIFEAD